jgi:hypothetical protein
MQEKYCVEIKLNKRAMCVESECNKYAKGKIISVLHMEVVRGVLSRIAIRV